MSAAEGTRLEPKELETYCPIDGEVAAKLLDGTFHCPVCHLAIPRRILNNGPRPEDVEVDG